MKAASNEPTPGALAALLAGSNHIVMWEVYTVTLVDGTVLTWVNGDVAGVVGPSSVGAESTANLTG